MKNGDKVKAVKGEFMGKVGEIYSTYLLTEVIGLPGPKGLQVENPMSHFIVKEKDGSIFPALESELELVT